MRRARRASIRVSDHRRASAVGENRAWPVLWQCLESNWETSELMWDVWTRDELRAALAREEHSLDLRRALRLTRRHRSASTFGAGDDTAPHQLHRAVPWSAKEFTVFYPSLLRELWVEGFCVRLLVREMAEGRGPVEEELHPRRLACVVLRPIPSAVLRGFLPPSTRRCSPHLFSLLSLLSALSSLLSLFVPPSSRCGTSLDTDF